MERASSNDASHFKGAEPYGDYRLAWRLLIARNLASIFLNGPHRLILGRAGAHDTWQNKEQRKSGEQVLIHGFPPEDYGAGVNVLAAIAWLKMGLLVFSSVGAAKAVHEESPLVDAPTPVQRILLIGAG